MNQVKDKVAEATTAVAEAATATAQATEKVMDSPVVDSIEDKFVQSLDVVQEWIGAGGDFVAEQAPLVVQEILAWGFFSALFFFIVSVLTMIAGIIVLRLMHKIEDKPNHSEADLMGFGLCYIFFGAVPSFMGAIFAAVNAYTMLYITVAPRLYLIEKGAELIQKFQ